MKNVFSNFNRMSAFYIHQLHTLVGLLLACKRSYGSYKVLLVSLLALYTEKMRVKTRNFAHFRSCDLPRTRVHSRPDAKIRYLPLFQIGQFGLSEARAVLAHESP